MEAVTFRLSAVAMDEMGWIDSEPKFLKSDEDLNEIVRAAKCTFKKAGKGGHYTFRCDVEQASALQEAVRNRGCVLLLSADKENRQAGRGLIKAADLIVSTIKKVRKNEGPS